MKKLLTLLTFLTINYSAWSQPVITSLTGAPNGTKTFGYNIPGAITPGTAGAAQVWDYSSVVHDTSSYYFKTVDYAGLTQAMKDSFPTGNVASEYYLSGNLVATAVYQLEPAYFLYLGLNTLVYAVPDTQLVFPHSYQETHAGFTYDAYGTLKTPFGTYNDVVRLREVIGSQFKYNYWQFSPVYTVLMEYRVDTITQVVSNQAFFNVETATALEDVSEESAALNLFPNPAASSFNLQTSLTGDAQLQIVDIQGRILLSDPVSLKAGIPLNVNTASLQKGLYFVKVTIGNKELSRKIVLQ